MLKLGLSRVHTPYGTKGIRTIFKGVRADKNAPKFSS